MAEKVILTSGLDEDGEIVLPEDEVQDVGGYLKRMLDLSELPDKKIVMALMLQFGKLLIVRAAEGFEGVKVDYTSLRRSYEYYSKTLKPCG